jgi:hypothetical protein
MASFDSVKPGTLYHRLKAGSGQGLVHGRHHIVCTCNAFVSDPEWLHVRDESEKVEPRRSYQQSNSKSDKLLGFGMIHALQEVEFSHHNKT